MLEKTALQRAGFWASTSLSYLAQHQVFVTKQLLWLLVSEIPLHHHLFGFCLMLLQANSRSWCHALACRKTGASSQTLNYLVILHEEGIPLISFWFLCSRFLSHNCGRCAGMEKSTKQALDFGLRLSVWLGEASANIFYRLTAAAHLSRRGTHDGLCHSPAALHDHRQVTSGLLCCHARTQSWGSLTPQGLKGSLGSPSGHVHHLNLVLNWFLTYLLLLWLMC